MFNQDYYCVQHKSTSPVNADNLVNFDSFLFDAHFVFFLYKNTREFTSNFGCFLQKIKYKLSLRNENAKF